MSDMIWGKNSINEALKTDRIQEAYVLADSAYIPELKKRKIPFTIKKRFELDKMSKSANHQGIIALVEEYKLSKVEDMLKDHHGLIVVLDGLKDPHNLGAILRTADSIGVDGVIYKSHNSVKLNSTVAKVASGAIEYVKVAEVTNLTKTLKMLKEKGYWVIGTDAKAKQSYTDLDYDMNVVLVIGSEGEGISRLVLEECDFLIKLPLLGHVNSLNASVAAGILLYNIHHTRYPF